MIQVKDHLGNKGQPRVIAGGNKHTIGRNVRWAGRATEMGIPSPNCSQRRRCAENRRGRITEFALPLAILALTVFSI